MGLGGYLAARSDAEHFANEKLREEREVQVVPDVEELEVAEVFQHYGLTDAEIAPILRAFRNNHPAWVDFMMRFELGLEEPDPRRALSSALTIAGAYIAGGLIPLSPYMVHRLDPHRAARLDCSSPWRRCWPSATSKAGSPARGRGGVPLQTTLIGGVAATAAFLIARVFS